MGKALIQTQAKGTTVPSPWLSSDRRRYFHREIPVISLSPLLLYYFFPIGNNCAWDKSHWLQYGHCAKLCPPFYITRAILGSPAKRLLSRHEATGKVTRCRSVEVKGQRDSYLDGKKPQGRRKSAVGNQNATPEKGKEKKQIKLYQHLNRNRHFSTSKGLPSSG